VWWSYKTTPMGSSMSRPLISGILLFVCLLANSSLAQEKREPKVGSSPSGSEITFQWVYSCPSTGACSFECRGAGGANHVTKLTINLGTVPLGGNQSAPAVFYDFSTREIPHSNGFKISTGLNDLACQVNGLTLDYSGPPK
jgi:hypothetical protein